MNDESGRMWKGAVLSYPSVSLREQNIRIYFNQDTRLRAENEDQNLPSMKNT
jgi:hypothetical protein